MNPLAKELNSQLSEKSLSIFSMMSDFGKALFFPKGILTQSAEAKEKAYKFNATVGIATDGKVPLVLDHFYQDYFRNMSKSEVFNYQSSYGNADLRTLWKEKITKENPSMGSVSLPLITTGITNGVSIIADMFFTKGDSLILANQLWGNYRMIFSVKKEVTLKPFQLFDNDKFNKNSFEDKLNEVAKESDTIRILLNFPNNPTGYSITNDEAKFITETLKKIAEKGKKILVLIDDAYFGLFYEDDVLKESIFSLLSNIHENILAVKLDGISKEMFAWGLRLGFITFGSKGFSESDYLPLEKKGGGAIRADISNCSAIAQSAVINYLKSGQFKIENEKNKNILMKRAREVKSVIKSGNYEDEFIAYPFNSGYFMLVKLLKHNSEEIRVHLLNKYGIGTISTTASDLRVAFSCLPKENIKELFDTLYKVCKEI